MEPDLKTYGDLVNFYKNGVDIENVFVYLPFGFTKLAGIKVILEQAQRDAKLDKGQLYFDLEKPITFKEYKTIKLNHINKVPWI